MLWVSHSQYDITFGSRFHDPSTSRISSELFDKYIVVSRQHEGNRYEVYKDIEVNIYLKYMHKID